jgi:hypothetical protein
VTVMCRLQYPHEGCARRLVEKRSAYDGLAAPGLLIPHVVWHCKCRTDARERLGEAFLTSKWMSWVFHK